MRNYGVLTILLGGAVLASCGSPNQEAAPDVETGASQSEVSLPADFPSDIALPEDTKLVLASRPVPGDIFIEGRSKQGAKEIVEGFAQRLADAGYSLTDREKIVDPLELYFEGKSVEGGNIRVRDDGTERDFMLTFTKAGR